MSTIKSYQYVHANGNRSMHYLGAPTVQGIMNLLNSDNVVGIEWVRGPEPCESISPFTIEGERVVCENRDGSKCEGSHAHWYEVTADDTYYSTIVELTWED